MTALEELTDLAGEGSDINIMNIGFGWAIQLNLTADNGAKLSFSVRGENSIEEAAWKILAQRNTIFDAPRKAFASKMIEAPRVEIDDEIPF